MNRFKYAFLALKELGIQKLSLYALYQIGIWTGHWQRVTPAKDSASFNLYQPGSFKRFPWRPPDPSTLTNIIADQSPQVISEANLICEGQIRFFHGKTRSLNLAPQGTQKHWSQIKDDDGHQDIKFIWEPARFGWAYTLCRAYLLTQDERYPEIFWKYTLQFIENNPVNRGPNWASGQEIALRLIAMIIAGVVFQDSPASTAEREKILVTSLYHHAVRLPKTLIYARAQNNNHLVTEAAGIFTAGVFFNNEQWKATGWSWLETALRQQIDSRGTYIQHSTNYHRLMLQAVLWVHALASSVKLEFSPHIKDRLASAVKWLIAYMDPVSGRAANLGHNDGSLIMPLSSCGYSDYRPVAQAASVAFLNQPCLPPGPWQEYCAWLGIVPVSQPGVRDELENLHQPNILRVGSKQTWAILRAEKYTDRPAHADQLHVDLWWDGENIAMDPGTYRYTAPRPWMNGLAGTRFHNTIEINDQDQMRRAGRFLWLNWAAASPLASPPSDDKCLSAEHNGYRKLGVVHQRTICHLSPLSWTITDRIYSASRLPNTCKIGLHWLLPNWDWNLEGDRLSLKKGRKQIDLWITAKDHNRQFQNTQYIQIISAGEVLSGPSEDLPGFGWFSPTYDVKVPALSLRCVYSSSLPLEIKTCWNLKEINSLSN